MVAYLNTLLITWVGQIDDIGDPVSSPGDLPNPNVFLRDPKVVVFLVVAVLVIVVLKMLDNRDES